MPRIFIAIQFNHEVKATLLSLQDALRSKGVKGNYCPYGNLHMTLAFIGESYDLPAIRKAVGEVAFTPLLSPHIPAPTPHKSALYRHQGSRDADNGRENKRDEIGED